MQRYNVYLYRETALHVSGGTSTHHQERIQLYLQHLVFVTPLLLSAAIVKELELVWVCCGWRTPPVVWQPDRPRPTTLLPPRSNCKPEAATAVDKLLMMGMRMPETCWAVFKRQTINLRASGWLIYLNIWWCTDLQTLNILLDFPCSFSVPPGSRWGITSTSSFQKLSDPSTIDTLFIVRDSRS